MGEKRKLRLAYGIQNKNIKNMTMYCASTYTN